MLMLALGNLEEYFGYVVKGAQIVGETSGAVATVTNIDLFSDNWGDLLGAFFFRDANAQLQNHQLSSDLVQRPSE